MRAQYVCSVGIHAWLVSNSYCLYCTLFFQFPRWPGNFRVKTRHHFACIVLQLSSESYSSTEWTSLTALDLPHRCTPIFSSISVSRILLKKSTLWGKTMLSSYWRLFLSSTPSRMRKSTELLRHKTPEFILDVASQQTRPQFCRLQIIESHSFKFVFLYFCLPLYGEIKICKNAFIRNSKGRQTSLMSCGY